MVPEISKRRAFNQSGRRRPDCIPSGALDQDLLALDAQPPGLVYQPSALVGASSASLAQGRGGPPRIPRYATYDRARAGEHLRRGGRSLIRVTASNRVR